MEHRIEITLAGRKYAATYQGEHIGDFKSPETEGARWLKANAGAVDSDALVTTRNGQPAMRGSVGWFAGHSVLDNEKISARWVKYRPFDAAARVGSAQDGHGEVFGTRVAPEAVEPVLEAA
jgi:hypothetical protein